MSFAAYLPVLLTGLVTGLGLIVAIGAQNAYVLQRAVRGDTRMAPVVAVCVASEALLIGGGVLGIGAVLAAAPWAVTAMRWAGAAFLVAYGVFAARRAVGPAEALDAGSGAPAGPTTVGAMLSVAAFTWLNPHAYLDTVVLLGTLANQQGPELRWGFAAGALVAGTVWFCALGFGGRLLRGLFARPSAWRVLDAVIAVLMLVLAVLLVRG